MTPTWKCCMQPWCLTENNRKSYGTILSFDFVSIVTLITEATNETFKKQESAFNAMNFYWLLLGVGDTGWC